MWLVFVSYPASEDKGSKLKVIETGKKKPVRPESTLKKCLQPSIYSITYHLLSSLVFKTVKV